jgi:hypothetical protein
MKKLLFVAACVFATAAALAQGSVNFSTRGLGTTAQILTQDGSAGVDSTFMAQLYAGPTSSSLAPVGVATAFGTGSRAGYISFGEVDIATVVPGATAQITMKAWEAAKGATFEASLGAGGLTYASPVFSVVTGGNGSPPAVPADLVGLIGGRVTGVPEPSTLALAALGAAALMLRRRNS